MTTLIAVLARWVIVVFAFGIGLTGLSSRVASSLKDQVKPESSSDESIVTFYE